MATSMQQLAEGKTKVINQCSDNAGEVLIVSKDSITAGNGLKKDELPGKGKYATITTCNIFRLLEISGIQTHYISQESEDSFRATKCSMIPLEVIVRRLATGSYLKRHPELQQGHRFDPPLVEFTFKDDVLGDPLISEQEIVAKKLQYNNKQIDSSVVEQLKMLALKSFLIVEKGWKSIDVALADFKVEFGVTPEGQVILADVIDNDSWRIWPKGDPNLMKDKQVYRNLVGQLQPDQKAALVENYAWVAENSLRLLDSVLPQNTLSPLVGVIMGSQSDWDTMKNTTITLSKLGIPFEAKIVSAHRTPERLFAYAKTAKARGLKVIVAGAGGAAHLPGMVSSLTPLPVLGVPVQSKALNGLDSLLSIAQMPGGVPVGTLAIGASGATNAALLAASILASSGNYPDIEAALDRFRLNQTDSVAEEPEPTDHPFNVGPFTQLLQIEKMLPPGSKIGIIGGGQLAKMIATSAAQLGYKSHIYCPDKQSPAFQVTDLYTIARYDDNQALNLFAGKVDVITYEFENVPKETVEYLEKWTPVRPTSKVLSICQNRLKEKTFVNNVGVATTKFESIHSSKELESALARIGYPAVLKTNTMGYDGKGQIIIRQGDNLDDVWQRMLKMGGEDSILEAFIDFTMEVSVIIARGFDGKKVSLPVVENRHKNHILDETIVPAPISDELKRAALDAADKIADGFNLVGLIAVEMFVTKDNRILVNEMAPRPHNSGHWSIEGCETSQFEQLIRAICGLPLGSVATRAKKITMKNLIGDEINLWESFLTQPNTHVHVYGKSEARPGRKMGHITTLFH